MFFQGQYLTKSQYYLPVGVLVLTKRETRLIISQEINRSNTRPSLLPNMKLKNDIAVFSYEKGSYWVPKKTRIRFVVFLRSQSSNPSLTPQCQQAFQNMNRYYGDLCKVTEYLSRLNSRTNFFTVYHKREIKPSMRRENWIFHWGVNHFTIV